MDNSVLKSRMQEALELKTGEAFEIIYHGGSSPGSRRTILPLKVDGHLVYAKCFDSNSEKHFRFDRMELSEGQEAPKWRPMAEPESQKQPKTKSKTKEEPASKKKIFGVSMALGLIAFFFLGLAGFLVVFPLFLWAGYLNNKKIRADGSSTNTSLSDNKTVSPSTTENQDDEIIFAPVNTSDSTVKVHKSAPKPNIQRVPTPTTKTEARQMVKELKTKEDVASFIQSCERAQDEVHDNHHLSEKQLERLDEILSDAIDLAEYKTLFKQYLPNADIYTPLEDLKMAYQVLPVDEYSKLPTKFKKDKQDYWQELSAEDEPDIPDEFIDNLIAFREIVESNLPDDEVVKAIDDYLAEHPIFMEEHFGEKDEDDTLTHGQEWFASKLAQLGLPAAFELYADGYTTIENALTIDPEDFIKRKGIGPKKKAQLIEFQEKHKTL
jgi:hypothetical protein